MNRPKRLERLRPKISKGASYLFAAALLFILGVSAGATGFIGKVTMEDGITPLSGASVQVVDTNSDSILYNTTTAGDGTYSLAAVSPGTYHIQAVPAGYFPGFRGSYIVASGQDLTVNFSLQSTGSEPYRDEFSNITGWSQPFGATSLTSNGNVMKYRSVISGGSYQGILKDLPQTYDKAVYPYISIRNKVSLNSGKLQSVDLTFDYQDGWGRRIVFASAYQSVPWQDVTYAVPAWGDPYPWSQLFLINDADDIVASLDVDHYFDHLIIHSADRGYVGGLVTDQAAAPLANIRVELLKNGVKINEGLTDASGNYSIWALTSAADYTVRASTNGGSSFSQGSVGISGRTLTPVNLTLDTTLPGGCGYWLDVAQSGSGDYLSIQDAVNALPVYLSTDTCVIIRDTQTYSEQITVQGFINNGYRLIIMADPTFISSAPAVNPPEWSNAGFRVFNDSVTVQGINIISTNTVAYGILSSSVSVNISSVNVISGGKIGTAGISVSSRSTVSSSGITVEAAHGILLGGSNSRVSSTTISVDGGDGYFALALQNASSNTITQCHVNNVSGIGVYLFPGSSGNTISFSTLTVNSATNQALTLDHSVSNIITGNYIFNESRIGMALYYADNNHISQNTIRNNAAYSALTFQSSSSNTITQSDIASPAGNGVQLFPDSNGNNISYSTMTGNAVGKYALYIDGSSSNTVSDSYVHGYGAAMITGAIGTVIGGSVFIATDTAGTGLWVNGGNINLALSSSTLTGGLNGGGINFTSNNSGAIILSSNTVSGVRYGLNIDALTAGAALSITSMTFQSLTPGATAINFLGGQFVSTFTGVAFNSADIGINVNGIALLAGSRITIHNSTGVKNGFAFENDPSNYVDWDDIIPPAAVTDLAASIGSIAGEIQLSWSAPGDDESSGQLPTGSKFRVFYSSVPADMAGLSVSASTTTSLFRTDISTFNINPAAAQYYAVGGLAADSTYYSRIFTADEAANWSTLSNGATVYLAVGATPYVKAVYRTGADQPTDIISSLNGEVLYVNTSISGSTSAGKVRVFSSTSGVSLADISVGYGPNGLVLTPDGLYGFTGNTVNGYKATKFNAVNYTKVGDVGTGTDSAGMAITADGNYVYMANHWSGFLSVINAVTNAAYTTVAGIGSGSYDVMITPNGKYVYALGRTGNIYKVSTGNNTLLNTIIKSFGGSGAHQINSSPDGKQLYLGGSSSLSAHVYSAETDAEIYTVNLSTWVYNAKPDPSGRYIYASANHKVVVISTGDWQQVASVNLGSNIAANPESIAFSPDGKYCYVALTDARTVAVINTNGYGGPPPGIVSGKVTNADGTIQLAGAVVEALQSSVVKSSAVADSAGDYLLALSSGTYDLTLSSNGYQTKYLTGIAVVSGSTQTADFKMNYPLPAGCGEGFNIDNAGAGDYSVIQAAVSALPVWFSTTTCIVIRDTQTYSEQVTVQGIETNGYRLKIMADPTFISSAPAVNPPVASTAAFQIANASVTITGINIISTNTVSYGILASSSSVDLSSVNVISGGKIGGAGIRISSYSAVSFSSITVQLANGLMLTGLNSEVSFSTMTSLSGYAALYLAGSGSNTVTHSYISNPSGYGAKLESGANLNTISDSTVTSNSGYYALYIADSDSNTVTRSYISNPGSSGYGVYLYSGADNNTIAYSTITSNSTGSISLYIGGSSSNTITRSVVSSPLGYGAWLNTGADHNTVSYSSITSNASLYPTLYIENSNFNKVTRSLVSNPAGTGAYLYSGSDNNAISDSTMTSNAAGKYALYIVGSGSNTVARSFVSNPAGTGAYLQSGADYNTISASTITGNTTYAGLFMTTGSSNTVLGSYIQGSPAVQISYSTGTVIGGAVLVTANAAGSGLWLAGGSVNLSLSSSTFAGGAQGAGIYLAGGNSGVITLSSNTIKGGQFGLNIAAQGGGASLSVASMTFQSLTAGATAINFLGGQFVSTFTAVAFNSTNTAMNVNGSLLLPGSRITMKQAAGAKAGMMYENDPSGYVDWADLPAGCSLGLNVAKNGTGNFKSIQAAVDAVPFSLSTNTCVVIRDTQTYSEQVTVAGFVNNGYRLMIMKDPTFISSAPVVNPPVASTAAFQLASASVTVQGINIISTNTVPYGIFASSANINISSVNVAGGSKISFAGVSVSSFSNISGSTITVSFASYALKLNGSFNTVGLSSITNSGYGTAEFGCPLTLDAVALAITGSNNQVFQSTVVGGNGNTPISCLMNGGDAFAIFIASSSGNSLSALRIVPGGGGGGGFNGSNYGGPGAKGGGGGASYSNAGGNSYVLYLYNASTNTLSAITIDENGGTGSNGAAGGGGCAGGAGGAAASGTGGNAYAVYLNKSSSNTLSDIVIAQTGCTAGTPGGGATGSGGGYGWTAPGAAYAVYLNNSSSNTLSGINVTQSGGTGGAGASYGGGGAGGGNGGTGGGNNGGKAYAMYVNGSWNHFLNSAFSVTGGIPGAGGASSATAVIALVGASSNTLTNIFMSGASGLVLDSNSGFNAVSYSTITSLTLDARYFGFYSSGSYNTAANSNFSGYYGAVLGGSGAKFNNIRLSTMSSSSGIGLYVNRASSNTLAGSYISGSTAAYVNGSTSTFIRGSVLSATGDGHGLNFAGGGVGLFLATSTLSGGVSGSAVYLDAYNTGKLELSSNTIAGGAYGLNIAVQSAGATLSVSSITFQGLLPGATAINFLGGQFVSTFTNVAFDSMDMAVSVNGSLLDSGSRVTMRSDTGLGGGARNERDPYGYVDWPEHPCDTRTSIATGLWSAATTWDVGVVPVACSPVTVAAGHTVTLDMANAVSSTAAINGILKASRVASSSWTLAGGDINVNAGGTLDYGSEADTIPSAVNAHLVLSSCAYDGQYGLIVNNGGNFTVRGSTKTPYAFATASIGAVATSLMVYGSTSVAGWGGGDVITIGPTSGGVNAITSTRTIQGLSAGPNYSIGWSNGALGTARMLSSTSPIIVGNLTRNVLVRSSGTAAGDSAYILNLTQNATSFSLTHGEFAYLGASAAGKNGITFNGAGTKGSISSSTVRNGYRGIYISDSSSITLTNNNIYSNSDSGISSYYSNNNTLTGNNVYSNTSYGIWLSGSSNNTLTGNNSYSNSQEGIEVYNSNNNILTGNNSYSNLGNGIYHTGSAGNTLAGNNFYSNSGIGIYLSGSSNNTLTGNNFYSNSVGINLDGTSNNTLTGNNSSANIGDGLSLYNAANNTLTGNNFYSNGSYGIYAYNSSSNTFIDGNIGYNAAGVSLKNTTAEIGFVPGTPATPETLILKGARVNPAVGISTAGMDVAGASLISYNQNADTGTVRIWGNYRLAGSTLTLDHAQQLYVSTATVPKLMRGAGHSASVAAVYDTYAVSQLITITYRSGMWQVDGSSSGVNMISFVGSQANLDMPISNPQFKLNFTEGGAPQEGDAVDFALTAASNDAVKQKKLLFGPAASTFNNGRSKLEVGPTGGIILRGKTDGTANTLVNMLAGSTYYTFVDSGAFTASYSSFTNMDQGGIQLSGNKGVSISSSTFDYLGFASGTNAYITARDLNSNAVLNNVTFGLSRSSAGFSSAYNVRVEGADANLNWTLTTPGGLLWGERYDSDTNSKVNWVNCGALVSIQSGPWSEIETWNLGSIPSACNTVSVSAGHTVTLGVMNAVSSTTAINGTLKASRVASSSWTLAGGDINVNAGGILDYGSEADTIPAAINSHLVLAAGAYAGQYGLIVNNGGNFTVRGSTKTPYAFATASIGAGANSLTVYGSTSTYGWQAGDVITIGPTSGNGVTTTSSRTITGIGAVGNIYTVSWSAAEPLDTARTLTPETPIIVGNLTRNVLVRSSGTVIGTNSSYIQNLAQNTTSFSLTQGEFAYLGAAVSGKYGITFNGALTKGSISSSTVRNSHYGITLNVSSTNTLNGNNFYSNIYGIYLNSSSNNTLSENNIYSNSYGIYLTGSSNNTLSGNNSYSNSFGVNLWAFSNYNTLFRNNSYSNSSESIYLNSSSSNTLTGNNSYSNSSHGIYLVGSNNTLTGNNSYSNSGNGIYLYNAYNHTLTRNNSYSNSYGIYAYSSLNNNYIDGNIGYNAAGDSLNNTAAEIGFDPGGSAETLILKGTRVNPAGVISTDGMDVAGASLISYNQDYSTGTVKLWGNYQLAGSTLTLDHAAQLYTSTATAPRLMRGTGHSASVVSTNDPYALSQLITIRFDGSIFNWRVEGSSSGLLGTFNGPITNQPFPAANSQFNLTATPGSVEHGDRLDFALTAASNDANVQKKLLFGPAASGFNNGRSKLEVASTGGIVLRGKTDGKANTLVDWLNAASTYYTFVDSGAFTAAYSSFTNMDAGGIQLSGNKGVAISSSSFDFLGFASGPNAYLTARDLVSSAVLDNVSFGLSRSSAGFGSAYNLNVEGADSGLNLLFRKSLFSLGPLWGEDYNYDPGFKVAWSDGSPSFPGCEAGFNVKKDGSANYTSIQTAVDELDHNLTADTCVIIRDAQTYAEQVTVQGFTSNGYRLKIMADPTFVSSAPVVAPPALSTAAFQIMNASVNVQGINILPTNPVAYGILASSASVTISSVNIVSGGNIWTAGIALSSSNVLSNSSITVQDAYGLYLSGSFGTSVSYTTATANSVNARALYLNNASSSSFTRGYLSNSGGSGVSILNSVFSDISQSTVACYQTCVLFDTGASSNSLTQSYVRSTYGGGVTFTNSASYNTVSLSTIVYTGYSGMGVWFMTGPIYNTVSQSLISSQDGYGAYFSDSSRFNAVDDSSVTNNSANFSAVMFGGSGYSNAVNRSFVNNQTGRGLQFNPGVKFNTVSGSTITAASYGVYFNKSSSNTIAGSYIQGSTAAYVGGSTGTVIGGSVFVASYGARSALQLAGGSLNLLLSSSAFNGGPLGAGVYLDAYNSGVINLSSNIINGGVYCLNIATQTAGASIIITSNTITPVVSALRDTYGIYLDGLVSGATIYNNGIYYRIPGNNSGRVTYGFYAKSAAGLNFRNNRINQPDFLSGGSVVSAYLADVQSTALSYNDINLDGTGLTNAVFLQLANSTAAVKNNVFFYGTTAVGIFADAQSGIDSDYNDWYGQAAFSAAIWGAQNYPLLSDWQAAGKDVHSIAANPRWYSDAAGAEDFHPKSAKGRFDPATQTFVPDAQTSRTIDSADPAEPVGGEQDQNGGRANQGSYGQTSEASQSVPAPVSPVLSAASASTASISWGGVTPLYGYLAEASLVPDFTSGMISSATADSGELSLEVQNLDSNTTYYFRAGALWGDTTAYALAVPGAGVTLSDVVPGVNIAGVYLSSAAVNWTALPAGPPSAACEGYLVQASTASDFTGLVFSSSTGNPQLATLSVADLFPNTTYYFRAGTLNWIGGINFAPALSSSTYAMRPGSATVFAQVSSVSVTVEWLSNGNAPGTRYLVNGSSDNFTSITVSSVASDTYIEPYSLIFNGLSPNTTYFFNVAAIGNNGAFSEVLPLGSTVTKIVSPVLTEYSLWAASATVVWDPNGNGFGTLYECDLSTASNFSGPLVSSATLSTWLSLPDLFPNTTYYLRLRARSAASGQSSGYVTAEGLSLADAPSSVGFYTVGPNSVGLYWNGGLNPGGLGSSPWSGSGTMPAGRYGHSAAVSGDLLLLSGGNDGAGYRSEVWSAPLSVNGVLGSWQQSRSLPGARYGHGSAALKGRLYILGGYDGTAARSEVWSAPISSSGALGEWVAEAALPQALYAHAALAYGETLYVFGGYGAGARDEVWKTALNSDGTLAGWNLAGTMPQARYAHAVGVAFTTGTPRIFLAGGNDGVSARSEAWTVGMNGDGTLTGWTAVTPLPNALFGHAMAGAPGGLFVTGGNNGSMARRATLRAAVKPDGTLGAWEAQEDLPQAVQSHALVERYGRLIALGGYDGAAAKDAVYSSVIRGTEYSIAVTGASFSSTPWSAAGTITLGGLGPDTSYLFSVAARNYAGAVTAYSPALSTFTYAAQPSTAAFGGVYMSSVQVNWLINDNHAAVVYQVELSSDEAHTLPAAALSVTGSSATFTGLDDDHLYYARARAVNSVNIFTPWTELGSAQTRADPQLDFSSPTIANYQSGDTTWRNSANGVYNIDFADTGGAYLSRFQIRASTNSGGSGPFSPDWTDVVTEINSNSYSADFSLQASTFSLLEPGTNYISVRVFDGNYNSSETVDAFYILKDTAAPVITDTQNGETDWRMDDAGAVYNVDFADDLSGLGGFEYSASTHQGSGNATALGWTQIASLTSGATAYSDNWAVDFAALTNDATNYISVRAWDLAGNMVDDSGIDVFKILKYVSGPEVAITAPNTAYLSSVALITGTASDLRSHAMAGTEIAFLDVASGRFWNGTDFLASAHVWIAVSTETSWSYAPVVPWTGGVQYQVVARSSDVAGNYSVAYATRTFTFDAAAPVLTSLVPADGATVNSLASVSGTAYDASGISSLGLRFMRSADGLWWDFNAGTWTAAGSSAAVTASDGWSYAPGELLKASLETMTSYYFTLYAADNSVPANASQFGVYGSTFAFLDDTAPAAIADLTASTGNVPGNISLTWSAPGDDGGTGMILYGRYKIQYSTMPLVVFSTADAQAGDTFTAVSAGSARAKEVTSLVPGETYYLRAWTMDDAGNWSALSNGATTQAAPYPDRISGHVMKVSSEGITGVLVEAFDIFGALKASAFTVADGSGSYVLSPLPSGSYRVQATWTADDIISSVGTDSVALGASNADFTLAITYELASIGGELAGYRLSPSAYKAQGAKPRSAVNVELYQHNRLIATAPVDAAGKFLIKNLLPGKYILKVPDANGGSKELSVSLKAGQALMINPLGELLKKEKVFAFPNPARKTVKFHIESDQSPLVKQVTVLDITGRVIKEFKDGDFDLISAGVWEARWNIPSRVASGVYIYTTRVKFEATGEHKKTIKKFAIVR